MEGWKAVLTIVLRYRMEARRREGLIRAVDRKFGGGGVNGRENGTGVNGTGDATVNGEGRTWESMDVDGDGTEESMEEDPVEAMMKGVKSKGVSVSASVFLLYCLFHHSWLPHFASVSSLVPKRR